MSDHIVDVNKMVPPPHLLKKFSEQAREDSQKRGHSGYCKIFATLCIDWAFKEAKMDDYRAASAEVSGVKLNSSITPPLELVQQWFKEAQRNDDPDAVCWIQATAAKAAQWGSDQELEACCEWFVRDWTDIETADKLRAARRPKPPTLKEQAQAELDRLIALISTEGAMAMAEPIRKALEQLND